MVNGACAYALRTGKEFPDLFAEKSIINRVSTFLNREPPVLKPLREQFKLNCFAAAVNAFDCYYLCFTSYPIQCPQSLKIENFAQLTDAFRVKQGANVRACFGMLLAQQHSAIANH